MVPLMVFSRVSAVAAILVAESPIDYGPISQSRHWNYNLWTAIGQNMPSAALRSMWFVFLERL